MTSEKPTKMRIYPTRQDITQARYFYIIRTLKKAGIITKSKGKYYISKVFASHLTKMASGFNALLIDLGADIS